ncbi:hypothetical protein ColLi_10894 [Colletotrichum liriopes]|uniref:Uncharacterized protein n=1 Tax=Colletotrichum liriopes TaxID=708192 RepID=A0AA37GX91_9PEZI|nr:hypothetical protein ColLi_10894 [Colletotrichum liriopes]
MASIVCHELLQPIDGEDDAGDFGNIKQLIRDCRTISKARDVAKSHLPFVVAVPRDQLIKVVAQTGMFRSIHDDHDSSDFRLRVKATKNTVSVSDLGYCFSKSLKGFTEALDPSDRQEAAASKPAAPQ